MDAHEKILADTEAAISEAGDSHQVLRDLELMKSEVLNSLGFLFIHYMDDADRAKECFDHALDIKTRPEFNDLKGIAMAHGGKADCYLQVGDLMEAKEECTKDYSISARIGDSQGKCRMTSLLGSIALREANKTREESTKEALLTEAGRYYKESFCIAQSQGNISNLLFAASGLLNVAVQARDTNTITEECERICQVFSMIDLAGSCHSEDSHQELAKAAERVAIAYPVAAECLSRLRGLLAQQ